MDEKTYMLVAWDNVSQEELQKFRDKLEKHVKISDEYIIICNAPFTHQTVTLKKRSRLERILFAPKTFIGQYKIFRRSQGIVDSMKCAWVMTKLIIKD